MTSAPRSEADFTELRLRMVEHDLRRRGICDRAVLEAFASVPREAFVPVQMRRYAYEDRPLPIGEGQTISQPHVVALMMASASLSSDDRVLDVGTGSGYSAALLSRVVATVWTIERHRSLADSASERLAELGYDNVRVICGDGTNGWPEAAPYDAVLVAAAARTIPQALLDQLADGGRLVIPVVGYAGWQELVCVRRQGSAFEESRVAEVSFVPLVPDSYPPAARSRRPAP